MSASWDNPCDKEAMLSKKCLEDARYDKSKCTLAFENYKKCKDFWMWVRIERTRRGIKPVLPSAQDRPAMKASYLKTGKIPYSVED